MGQAIGVQRGRRRQQPATREQRTVAAWPAAGWALSATRLKPELGARLDMPD
jgi:hypothetical protein